MARLGEQATAPDAFDHLMDWSLEVSLTGHRNLDPDYQEAVVSCWESLAASKQRREQTAHLRRRTRRAAPLALLGAALEAFIIVQPLPYKLWPLLVLGVLMMLPWFYNWRTWLEL